MMRDAIAFLENSKAHKKTTNSKYRIALHTTETHNVPEIKLKHICQERTRAYRVTTFCFNHVQNLESNEY